MKWIRDRDLAFFYQPRTGFGLPLSVFLTISDSLTISLCLSAYLLTKELSLCLSGRIVLNGDFLCNHLIIHQFPKKPQRGCVSTLCWRAKQWDREGKGRDFLEEMIKTNLIFFTCYRYLHSVCFLALPSSVFLERELIPISFWYSSSSFTCTIIDSLVSSLVCSGTLREQEHQLACICIEPYGDWNSHWIGVFFLPPLAVPSLCMTNLLH